MKIQATKSYLDIESAYKDKSGILLEGGSRSGKTFAIVQWLFLYAIQHPDCVITVGRDTSTTLRKTIWLDMKSINRSVGNYFSFNETMLQATGKKNQLIRCVGLNDDIMLTHGLTQEIFWINEAMNVSRDTFDQLEQRTSRFWICDYNPSSVDSWLYEVGIRKDIGFAKSTVLDNPFAPDASRRKILSYKPTAENIEAGTADSFKWSVYGLGERAVDESAIFQNIETYTVEPSGYDLLIYGGDFGFTDDPTVFVQCKIDGRNLYIREIFRNHGLTNAEIAEKAMDYKDEIQVWDSAERKSITELRLLGLNAIEATKGADSVIHGIQKLKQFRIFIHADSDECRKEFKSYRYAKGRNGDYIRNSKGQQVPEDKNNHSIDAVRYAVTKFATI